jgi:hypothetical protein
MPSNKRKQKKVSSRRDKIHNDPTNAYLRKQAKEESKRSRASNPEHLPKRPWREEAVEKANHSLKVAGGRGVDATADINRALTEEEAILQLPLSSSILDVTARVSDRAISYLAMGIVLRGIRRGLLAKQKFAEAPYYMFRLLIDAFTSAMRSSISILTEAPMWYWEIYHALKPKKRPFKTGEIQYKWEITETGSGNDQVFTLGLGPDQYSVYWGTGLPISTPDINGFPVLGPVGAPYTVELGAAAIASLWSTCTPKSPLIPDPGSDCSTYNDTSAFAVNYPELGSSFNSTGAFRSTIYSERHIDSPLLAKFAIYQPEGTALWRGWHKSGLGAGSSSMIGPRLMDVAGHTGLIRNKLPPTVKTYNFDEIFEQLSLTMCLALEYLSNSAGQTVPACPLTSQQVQILLRQAILPQFDNDMFQDLRYDSNQRVHLLPFVVGPNGSATTTVDMLLPTFLAENIRCMKSIEVKASEKFQDAVLVWHSVLCRPPPSEFPQLGNYVWGSGNTPLYATSPSEVLINIIDMSAQDNNSTLYLDATRLEIQVIKDFWNEWAASLQNVLSPLVSLTADRGVRVLNCNLLTNFVQQDPMIVPPVTPPTTVVTPARKKSIESVSRGISMASQRRKLGATPASGSSYFDTVSENEITSVQIIKPATFGYLSKFILPVDFANDQRDDSSSQGVRAFQMEPNKIPRSSAGGLGGPSGQPGSRPDALTRHLTAATIDAKAFATLGQNELIQGLMDVASSGRGGFFTSLVSNMVNTFSPEAASVISTIGNIVGV